MYAAAPMSTQPGAASAERTASARTIAAAITQGPRLWRNSATASRIVVISEPSRRPAGGGVRPGAGAIIREGSFPAAHDCVKGSETRNVVRPARESKRSEPSWRSTTIRRAVARPRPVPWPASLVV